MVYSSDAITFGYINNTSSVVTNVMVYDNVAGEVVTLLGASMNNGGGSGIANETTILCGSTKLVSNMGITSSGQLLYQFKCSQDITLGQVGKYTSFRETYVIRDVATTSDPLGGSTGTTTTAISYPQFEFFMLLVVGVIVFMGVSRLFK